MSRSVALSYLLVLAVAVPGQLCAQSSSATAGWIGLITTPVGAFAPTIFVPAPPAAERAWGIQARYSHWQFAPDDDNTTNLGLGAAFAVGSGRWSVDVGRTTKKDCAECDAYMIGSELFLPVASAAGGLGVALNPEVGFMTQSGDSDFSALAAAINLPVSYAVPIGADSRLVPFVSPGLGLARVSGGGFSETGQRLMVGGGVAVTHGGTGLQLTAGASRILFDGAATVLGITLAYGR
jgi:hypothetical protein